MKVCLHETGFRWIICVGNCPLIGREGGEPIASTAHPLSFLRSVERLSVGHGDGFPRTLLGADTTAFAVLKVDFQGEFPGDDPIGTIEPT